MTQIINLQKAANFLKNGHIVAFPTETVYGLGADATNDVAVAKIYTLKERPQFNPLIIHVQDVKTAQLYGAFSPLALRLADAFWPGPLTLIVPLLQHSKLSKLVTAGLSTVGLRVPNHPTAQALLRQTNLPLAAPSANPSGRLSPTEAGHVAKLFEGRDLMILSGQMASIGLESTIIDMTQESPVILRYGGLSIDDIQKHIPQIAFAEASDTIKAPGQLLRHYAPRVPLRLNVSEVREGEALLAFGKPLQTSGPALNLSKKGDLVEAASHLFSYLHALEERADITGIAVMPIPDRGVGHAINDRLRRGASREEKNE